MIDLHTHSTASDGTLTPAELIRAAAGKRLGTIALTDHDTIDGISEAQKAVDALEGQIRLIPGVELEIEWDRGEFHLLGLGLAAPSPSLLGLLDEFSRVRLNRNLAMLDKMNRLFGMNATYEEILAESKSPASVGRPHFASYLIRCRKVKTMELAFKRYLGVGLPLYVKKTGVDFARAATAIHESGGIAVIAHPATIYVSMGKLPDIFRELKEKGLDGIEAWHPNAKVHTCKRYETMAANMGLCVTAGSDFHGERRPDRKLGLTAGGLKIDDRFLPDALRDSYAQPDPQFKE
ncbi:MAG: PHP domain-containing protein [Spirochaetaceae bacterium]|jgi:predicted metal-dependent phosphoesterase TrpH|nr:PHP domain-containing protein [Spirochaetaceae bacterium]